MTDKEHVVSLKDLPFKANVKYLGSHPAKGLWGIKHTRKPVDVLVAQAKNLPPGKILPIVKLEVNTNGLKFKDVTKKDNSNSDTIEFGIDAISYGVQDLVYTRVFSIIVVIDTDLKNGLPFICHSFVCESRNQARQITYALAASFQEYGRRVKEDEAINNRNGGDDDDDDNNKKITTKKRFAIDLRTPEQQADASDDETEA